MIIMLNTVVFINSTKRIIKINKNNNLLNTTILFNNNFIGIRKNYFCNGNGNKNNDDDDDETDYSLVDYSNTMKEIKEDTITITTKPKFSIGGIYEDPDSKSIKDEEKENVESFDENGNLKPPEIPINCCGSGCGSNCVWDIYYDQMEEYNKKLKISNPHMIQMPDTSDSNEDPMQFFLKMERYNSMKQRKDKEIKEQQQQLNSNNNNHNNDT